MAGHSKWANIRHRKARQDAAKGKVWSKCSRAIIVAARSGGPDPDANLALRYAIDEAKAANMPKDTIDKAVRKGSGDLDKAEAYEEIRYEGYGPGGVAVIVDCLTDNVNRTAPEMRRIFEKTGGKLAKPGAVAFGFTARGLVLVDARRTDEEQIMELALTAGADDVVEAGDMWEITTGVAELIDVRRAVEAAGLEPDSAEIVLVPASTLRCDAPTAERVMRLVDALQDHDDVQKVHTNADIPDEIMAGLD